MSGEESSEFSNSKGNHSQIGVLVGDFESEGRNDATFWVASILLCLCVCVFVTVKDMVLTYMEFYLLFI